MKKLTPTKKMTLGIIIGFIVLLVLNYIFPDNKIIINASIISVGGYIVYLIFWLIKNFKW